MFDGGSSKDLFPVGWILYWGLYFVILGSFNIPSFLYYCQSELINMIEIIESNLKGGYDLQLDSTSTVTCVKIVQVFKL